MTTPDTNAAPSNGHPSTISRVAVPAMWMVAGVLLGVALFRGDSTSAQDVIRGLANRANAGMVSHSGTYAVMTNDAGNEDLVVVLDERTESIMVYRADPQKGIELQQRVALPSAFEDARLRTIGK